MNYLEARRLRWKNCAAADRADLDARHCAADVQVVVVEASHLHHSHAL